MNTLRLNLYICAAYLKRMKKYFSLLALIILIGIKGNGQSESFQYQNGDIVFQVGKGSNFEKAIFLVTSGIDDYDFSHVGVIYIENDEIFVLEATPKPGVTQTPLSDFLNESAVMVVGRLKPQYQYVIPGAFEKIKPLMGKPYDFTFHHNNDAYYCSELIQIAFIQKDGTPVFEPTPLTFIDKDTGETAAFWVEYYKKYDEPIPEGEQGSSPAGLSKSNAIEIIHKVVNQ
jgi:hypothetical protein